MFKRNLYSENVITAMKQYCVFQTINSSQQKKPKVHSSASAAVCVKVKVKAAYIKHKVDCRLRDRLDDDTGADSSIHRPPVLWQDPDVRILIVWPNQKDVKYFSSDGQQETNIPLWLFTETSQEASASPTAVRLFDFPQIDISYLWVMAWR